MASCPATAAPTARGSRTSPPLEAEAGVRGVAQQPLPAPDQGIQHRHPVPGLEEGAGDHGAHVPRPSRDQDVRHGAAHASRPFPGPRPILTLASPGPRTRDHRTWYSDLDSSPTRVGFVGVNDRARRLLLPGLVASPRARLAAVCSRDATRARAAAAALGPGVRPFTSVEEMAAQRRGGRRLRQHPHPRPRPRPAWRRSGPGCAVICEKPLAGEHRRGRRSLRAARAAGVRTAVNFTYRSVPGFRLTERILRQPGLGPPLHGEVALLQGHTFLPGYPRPAPSWRAASTCWTPCWPSPAGPGWGG